MSPGFQRKPLVYLLVILPILWAGALGAVAALLVAFSVLRRVPLADVPDLNGLLIGLPALALWIPISLLLGNVVLHSVPPLRRVAESFAAEADGPSYGEAQRLLLKLLGVLTPVCVPLLVAGFIV